MNITSDRSHDAHDRLHEILEEQINQNGECEFSTAMDTLIDELCLSYEEEEEVKYLYDNQ